MLRPAHFQPLLGVDPRPQEEGVRPQYGAGRAKDCPDGQRGPGFSLPHIGWGLGYPVKGWGEGYLETGVWSMRLNQLLKFPHFPGRFEGSSVLDLKEREWRRPLRVLVSAASPSCFGKHLDGWGSGVSQPQSLRNSQSEGKTYTLISGSPPLEGRHRGHAQAKR